MGTEVINSNFDVLQEELDRAKTNLRGLNDNIRRISGREPPDQLRLVLRYVHFDFINFNSILSQNRILIPLKRFIILFLPVPLVATTIIRNDRWTVDPIVNTIIEIAAMAVTHRHRQNVKWKRNQCSAVCRDRQTAKTTTNPN